MKRLLLVSAVALLMLAGCAVYTPGYRYGYGYATPYAGTYSYPYGYGYRSYGHRGYVAPPAIGFGYGRSWGGHPHWRGDGWRGPRPGGYGWGGRNSGGQRWGGHGGHHR